MKETNLNSEKFTLGVKLATEFIPGLRFHVQTSVKLQIDLKVLGTMYPNLYLTIRNSLVIMKSINN